MPTSLERIPIRTAWWSTGLTLALLLLPVPATLVGWESGSLLGLGFDKLVHLLLFAALCVIWSGAIGAGTRPLRLAALWLALAAFGAATEGLQALTGWRDGDIADFLADALGASLGAAGVAVRSALTSPRSLRYGARR